MSDINRQLYDYMKNNANAISDQTLSMRKEKQGSIYSSNAGELTESLLREQNILTNRTVSSILLEDKKIFRENKERWALEVAKSRARSNTPIYEVLGALSDARNSYWSFVERFVEQKGDKVTREDLLNWGIEIPSAFDKLKVGFSKLYYRIMDRRLIAQQNLIAELGSPIIKLDSSVGVLPLIGDIDTMRAKVFSDYIPTRCVEIDITHLYIDLSGVSIIDTMVTQELYQLTKVLNLLGIESTVTGIRPEIAQTSVQLGLDFSRIDTYSSLQQALSERFKKRR